MGTKLYLSSGTHINPENLEILAHCIDEPKEVLKKVHSNGYRIGGYGELGEVDTFGIGLVIKYANFENYNPRLFEDNISHFFKGFFLNFFDEIIPLLNKAKIEKKQFLEKGLIIPFKKLYGPLIIKRNGEYKSLFELPKNLIRKDDQEVICDAKEFVEVILNKKIDLNKKEDLEFMINLSKY